MRGERYRGVLLMGYGAKRPCWPCYHLRPVPREEIASDPSLWLVRPLVERAILEEQTSRAAEPRACGTRIA